MKRKVFITTKTAKQKLISNITFIWKIKKKNLRPKKLYHQNKFQECEINSIKSTSKVIKELIV